MILKFLTFISFCLLSSNLAFAEILDHKLFLEEMENSSDLVYSQCLLKYNNYLLEFPDDVSVQIEKCKFIQFAEYDDYEDYNPNQNEFDSCVKQLIEKFPNSPEVIIYQTSYLWGDELKELMTKAEISIKANPEKWDDENLATLYIKMADYYYWEEEYQLALGYNHKAININNKHKSSLLYAKLLIEIDKKNEARDILLSIKDTTKITWELSEKANLLLQLEAYTEALDLYKLIVEIDSSFNNNLEIAKTLEATGKYDFARSYLVADTNQNWSKETSIRNLLIHDIKYQDGVKCIQSYNKYRDLGFFVDPLGIYRLKVLLFHPLQALRFRDILGILTLVLLFALIILIPSIWILPVYFTGHHFNYLDKNKSFETQWGLKAFWFVSVGYLLASLSVVFVNPEIIYSDFNSYYSTELTQSENGLMALFFILIFALFSFATLYKKDYQILFKSSWTILRSILIVVGVFFLFRVVTGSYIKIGVYSFDISIDDIANIKNILFSSKQEIEALITCFGTVVGFILVCIIVPIYEEIVFRGVILDACHKYINFNTANIIQSFLFAAVHQDFFLFPVFFLFGIITGILRKKSGGLFTGIVFHVINNLLAISVFLFR